jgi:MerR family redox-sensitive transcriptional activator SoxR
MMIGDVAARLGVAASTLRYYERIGLMPEIRRVSGRRDYGPDDLKRLGLIRLAQKVGFTINDIQTLLHGFSDQTPPSARWRHAAESKRQDLNRQIEQARAMIRVLDGVLDCDCPTLDHCGDNFLLTDKAGNRA